MRHRDVRELWEEWGKLFEIQSTVLSHEGPYKAGFQVERDRKRGACEGEGGAHCNQHGAVTGV